MAKRRPHLSAGPISVLAIFAHPDDAEFLCSGTLALLADRGARLHIATMTAGDCGSTTLPPAKIAEVRQREARRAAQLIGAEYSCLGERDLSIIYDRRTLERTMELVRAAGARLVFTHSPVDYMVDHETTSRLVQTACFGTTAPNFRTGFRPAAKPLECIPHLYYAEPFGRRDIFGKPLNASIFVNIGETRLRKEEMLACHESQQVWLRHQQGIADNLAILRRMAQQAGRDSKFGWAEGFRQHLGQGFPQENLLKAFLKPLVRTRPAL